MKLLSVIWQTAAPWKTKRAFLTKLALDAAGAGDLPLALEAWRMAKELDAIVAQAVRCVSANAAPITVGIK